MKQTVLRSLLALFGILAAHPRAVAGGTAVPSWEQNYRPSLVGFGNQTPLAARELADGTVMVVDSDNSGLTAIRYDHSGSLISTASFQPPYGPYYVWDRRLAIDPFGAIFYAAPSDLMQDFSGDVWLMKYDGYSGRALWQSPAVFDSGFPIVDLPDQLFVDHAGDLVVVGRSLPYFSSGLKSVFALKLDGVTGEAKWSATTDLAYDEPTAAAIDSAGNVFVSYLDYASILPVTLKYGGADGALLWGPVPQSESAHPRVAVADRDGNLAVVSTRSAGLADDWRLLKYDGATGAILWGPSLWRGPGGEPIPTAISADSAGDLIVSGYVQGFGGTTTIKYDGVTGLALWGPQFFEGNSSESSLAVAGNGDIVVSSKTNSDMETRRYAGPTGDLIWSQTEPVTSLFALPIAFVASNGRIFTAGGTSSSGGFDGDAVALERDGESGAVAWGPTSFSGLADGRGRINDLAAGPDGNPVVGMNIEDTDGTHAIGIVKYARATGAVLWGPITFATPYMGAYYPYQVLVDAANNVFAAGTGSVIKLNGITGAVLWTSPLAFTPTRMALDASGNVVAIASVPAGINYRDFATIKLSGSDGAVLWGPVTFDNGGTDEYVISLGVDGAGDVVVTGRSVQISGGSSSWATLKYSGGNGAQLWGPILLDNGYVNDLALDAAGNAVVIGQVNSDMATIEYASTDGSVVWGPELLNGPGNYYEAATRLAIEPGGDVIVAGYESLVYPDTAWAIVRYRGSDGATLWGPVTLAGAGNGPDVPNAIALDAAGNVVVSGRMVNARQLVDATTVKYDGATGAVLWGPVLLGGLGDAEVNGLSVAAGSVVIAGRAGQTTFTLGYTDGFGIETMAADVPFATCGSDFAFDFVAQNGSPSYSWSKLSGTLPPGLTLSTSGSLSGVPAAEGVFSFVLKAQDSASASAQRDFTVRVVQAGPDVPLEAVAGPACSVVLSIPGSYASYLWLPGGETTPTLTVSPDSDTTYALIVTDVSGCEQHGSIDVAATKFLNPACEAPTAVSMTPDSGAAAGGTVVTIAGSGFQPGATVLIGGHSATGVSATPIQVAASTPPLDPGTANDVLVTNPNGGHAVLRRAFLIDFLDVAESNPFHDAIAAVLRAGIAAGCGGGSYCPTAPVTRAQMAVFLLKARLGASHVPPAGTGLVFADVPWNAFAGAWIEELYALGITGGCSTAPLQYCPEAIVTRAQMAVFLLKTSEGSSYVPPAATGTVFTDVPASAFAADWIEDLYARNVTAGCLTNPLRYCPGHTNNRQQMAVFITKTFGLQ